MMWMFSALFRLLRTRAFYVGGVVITHYSGQASADTFKTKLEHMDIRVYRHYTIDGYPGNVPLIVSDDGYGKMILSKLQSPLVIVTAPVPEAVRWSPACLSFITRINAA